MIFLLCGGAIFYGGIAPKPALQRVIPAEAGIHFQKNFYQPTSFFSGIKTTR
jgi:hypothetical protein